MEAVITIYQDTRRQKMDGTYPVKIKVYDGNKRVYYPTGIDLTEKDYTKVIGSGRLTGDLKKFRDQLDEKKSVATKLANKMDSFNISLFDRKFRNQEGKAGKRTTDVFACYDAKIHELLETDQIKTSYVYQHACDSLKRYLYSEKTTEELRALKVSMHFNEIDERFLRKYQKYMTDHENSLTTISMYLRTLRALFNQAIADKEISEDLYPFGEKKYQIPKGAGAKQALSKEDMRSLWQFKTKDPLLRKAKDFWFFVYNANGMNIRDVAKLRPSDIKGDSLYYRREKTIRTTKKEVIIEVPVTAHMRHVLQAYGGEGGDYVFDVLHKGMTAMEKVKASDAFVTFINDGMERIKKVCNISASCTTYSARHTFGTVAMRNGASMRLIQEAYGHQSFSTTENYLGDWEREEKRKVSEGLMKF